MAAALVLKELHQDRLRWIRIADPEAGRVDDLQIGSENRIDAYQVKWSQYSGAFTFNDLVSKGTGKPCSLIESLADGWRRIRASFPNHAVVVHLITNDYASTKDSARKASLPPAPRHFAAFLKQVWEVARRAPDMEHWSPPSAWKSTWVALQHASRLDAEEFAQFIQFCELDFAYQIPREEAASGRGTGGQHDVDQLADSLFATVADPSRIVEMTRSEILDALGWTRRLEFVSRHDFPVDLSPYSPNEACLNRLSQSLDALNSGYLAVLGTPGSGKSTLLTRALRERSERVVRYYAYVPDAQDPISLRGESKHFLHDINVAIERCGFRSQGGPPRSDRSELLPEFYRQLSRLHQDWLSTGRRTIILIDGLDHIEREQKPERSFLLDLPVPEQVPDGVLFVLGAQTDQLTDLPARIVHSIGRDERRIEMQSLPRAAVMKVIESADVSSRFTGAQREQAFSLCAGHPLALQYILNHLKSVTDDQIDAVLQSSHPFQSRIEAQYHAHWSEIRENSDLTQLLGRLARLRGCIHLECIEQLAPPALVDTLHRKAGQFFFRESPTRWYFFHDSFRRFVREATASTPGGVFSPERHQAFHRHLAETCAGAPSNSSLRWEELYHRVHAEEHQAVITLATQAHFRQQFFAYRPPDAIRWDIQVASRSAEICQDEIAMATLILAGAELIRRWDNLEGLRIPSLLAGVGKPDLAAAHSRDGNRLTTSETEALRVSCELYDIGLQHEARRLFDLAEPLDILNGGKIVDDRDADEDIVEAWVLAAPRFLPLQSLVATIRRIRREPDWREPSDEATSSRRFQNSVLFDLSRELIELGRESEVSAVLEAFDLADSEDQPWWFHIQVSRWKHRATSDDARSANAVLREVAEVTTHWELGHFGCLALAEAHLRIAKDTMAAHSIVADLRQPSLCDDVSPIDAGFRPFSERFRLNRLLYALGNDEDPVDIIEEAREPGKHGLTEFERYVCEVSRIWGIGWADKRLQPETIVHKVQPMLRLYYKEWNERRSQSLWYVVEGARIEFYEHLIEGVALHGSESLNRIRVAFEEEWASTPKYWPSKVRRAISLSFRDCGIGSEWAIDQLETIEQEVLGNLGTEDRLEEHIEQARVWATLGQNLRALRAVNRCWNDSFGIRSEKDYQLNAWIGWLGRVNEIEPEYACDRISRFAAVIQTVDRSGAGSAAREATQALLSVATQFSPRLGLTLLEWGFGEGLIEYAEGISLFVRESLGQSGEALLFAIPIIGEFILPVSTGSDKKLFHALGVEKGITQERLDAEQYLLGRIELSALPSSRRKWRKALREAFGGDDVWDSEDEPEQDGDRSFQPSIHLRDGTALTEADVRRRCTSVAELEQLMSCAEERSFYLWGSLVQSLAKSATYEELVILEHLLLGKPFASIPFAAISQRMSDLGEYESAWRLGTTALQLSGHSGWNPQLDGGTRFHAFEALARADSEKARDLAFHQLVTDFSGAHWYPLSLAINLDRILSLLDANSCTARVWSEIEEYLNSLFPGVQWDDDRLDSKRDVHPIEALSELILIQVGSLVSAVVEFAQRTCLHLLRSNDSRFRSVFRGYLVRSELYSQRLLTVLEAVVQDDPGAVSSFQDELRELVRSPNSELRFRAAGISRQLGTFVDTMPTVIRPLPPSYHLLLPPDHCVPNHDNSQLSESSVLPDARSRREAIGLLYIPILEMLASMSGIELDSLILRATQLMREISPENEWSAEAEHRYRSRLEAISLRLPYRRPRMVIAQQAVLRVVSEVIDSGVVDNDALALLENALRFCDAGMLRLPRSARTKVVVPMVGRSPHHYFDQKWVEDIEEAASAFDGELADGRVVIAQECRLQRLDWSRPREIRIECVWKPMTIAVTSKDAEKHTFAQCFNSRISEYPDLPVRNGGQLILRHTAFAYETPGEHWLALNPRIGLALGWVHASDGVCRWRGKSGETVVESMWWTDGLVEQFPYHPRTRWERDGWW